MTKSYFDCVVLGVGGMGSAALYTLARQGLKVCGIEQFGLAHDRGSSHGDTRMIRKAYFEHPDYMPLLHRTYDLWRDFECASGAGLFRQCDLVVAGRADSAVIQGLKACYEEHDLPYERMSGREANLRYPQFRFDDDFVANVDPVAGILYVERCIEQFCKQAVKSGAHIFSNEKVLSWKAVNGEIQLKTSKREIFSKKLILTTGAWACTELAKLNVHLRVWRKVFLWYRSGDSEKYRVGTMPTFYIQSGELGFYGFPAMDEHGIKVGEHQTAEPCEHPDSVARDLLPRDTATMKSLLKSYFRDFSPQLTRHSVCMYTMTPDHHFIIDRHPRHENVFIAAGFSGHGFKFAPVVGEILSDFVLHGTTNFPVDFLSLERFLRKDGTP